MSGRAHGEADLWMENGWRDWGHGDGGARPRHRRAPLHLRVVRLMDLLWAREAWRFRAEGSGRASVGLSQVVGAEVLPAREQELGLVPALAEVVVAQQEQAEAQAQARAGLQEAPPLALRCERCQTQ